MMGLKSGFPVRVGRAFATLCWPLLSAMIAVPATAATINVPADQPDVKAAVAAAASGDLILIAPGTHDGGVYIDGKVLTIASLFHTTGDTTYIAQTVLRNHVGDICGGNSSCRGDAVIEFSQNANGSAVIGLTITAPTGSISARKGVRSGSRVDITSCRVVGTADGVNWTSGGAGTFRNSLFANNDDDGIDLNDRVDLLVTNCVIRDNADDGIEFRMRPYSGPATLVEFIGNLITGNVQDGIQLIDSWDTTQRTLRMEKNVFSKNGFAAVGCDSNGNTIEDYYGTPMTERLYLIRNTFVGEEYGFVGGANVIALDNIFTGIRHAALRRVGGNSISSYDLFWNNGLDYEESVVDAAHLIYADPRLAANERLTAGSPAIDAGTAFYQWLGETVLNLPPSAYDGSAPDLGAFEDATPPPPVSAAPVVDAGPNQAVTLPASALLNGTVSDDGLPNPPGGLITSWSLMSGPAPVVFQDFRAVDTPVSFTADGVYWLRLSASDGEQNVADSVQVTVGTAPPGAGVVDRRVSTGSDDAEEVPTGTVYLTSSDLEMVMDGSNQQKAGMRFTSLAIPQAAVITRAYVQFEAKETQSDPTSLLIQGQAADNPGTFNDMILNDVSARPRTTAAVGWTPPPWTTAGQAGPDEQTPDLSSVIQEIVSRPGWSSGNAIVIVITGTGHRTAWAYNGKSAGAPLLHVEFNTGTAAVPPAPGAGRAFGLHSVSPIPARGAPRVDFSLADGSRALLEFLDVAGRRVRVQEVGAMGPGRHQVQLRDPLPAGLYLVRLSQGGRAWMAKAIVLR